MMTLHYRRALLVTIAILAQPGCGGRGGIQDGDQIVGGTAALSCQPGDTRECVGPGACRGGQQCDTHGSWGACDCGASGGATSTGASGGTSTVLPSNGGSATGGARSTGGTTSNTNFGGTAGTGGRAQGGSTLGSGGSGGVVGATGGSGGSRPTGGFGGVGGTSPRPSGGTGPGGATHTGGANSGGNPAGGNPAGGAATGGNPAGGAATGGAATGGAATGGATNRPPQITGLSFYPNPVTTNDTLYAYVDARDADNDRITYSYAWTCNGNAVGSNSSQLSGYLYFSKGDSIKVTVTPSDGKSFGDPATSQPIIVANATPQFYSWPTLSPAQFADDDAVLQCDATAEDPDGDAITYTYSWYKAGVLTSYHDSTLPNTATALGDMWSCEVLVSDGTTPGYAARSDTTTIMSTASGIYRTDTTWQAAKSPYLVTGRIQVAAGVTLTVEPGVTVVGNGNSLEFWGTFVMAGTAEKPILVQDLYTYDNSTAAKPGKFTMAFVEYVGGTLLGSGNAALVDVSDCVLRYLQGSVYLAPGLSAAHRFERNLFYEDCGLYSAGPLVLNSNTFTFTNSGCYDVVVQESLTASSNNFYPNTEMVVMAGNQSVDLHNSYWGGYTDAEVPGLIMDTNDDLNILGEVTYLPTLKDPSPSAPPTDKTYFP